ncbi:putative phage tail protein [Mesorhizobium sp. CAU 1732]|uniref:putative phage tail protein n=1 Tax=Mesorhizobium sp. CAU 1732 TaxID=3140358 RepID=UPI0032604A97
MSVWYVNADWPAFLAPDLGEVFFVSPDARAAPGLIETRDILSEPDVEMLLQGGLALWPRGSAWGTPDGEAPSVTSKIAGLTRVLLAPFAMLYASAWKLTLESRSATLVDSLDEWERDYGLPDPCVTEPQTITQRRDSLAARVQSLATITPADVVRMAARVGYIIALEEPEAFLVGESHCLGIGELSDAALEQQWVVHVFDAPASQFEAGIGDAGVTRLLDFDHGVLECAIRRIAPAWTAVVFSYASLLAGNILATESGDLFVTETGLLLVMPVAVD